jgi:hypothetical protein
MKLTDINGNEYEQGKLYRFTDSTTAVVLPLLEILESVVFNTGKYGFWDGCEEIDATEIGHVTKPVIHLRHNHWYLISHKQHGEVVALYRGVRGHFLCGGIEYLQPEWKVISEMIQGE